MYSLFILYHCYLGKCIQYQVLHNKYLTLESGCKNRGIPAGKNHCPVRMRTHIPLNFKLYAEYIAGGQRRIKVVSNLRYRIDISLCKNCLRFAKRYLAGEMAQGTVTHIQPQGDGAPLHSDLCL